MFLYLPAFFLGSFFLLTPGSRAFAFEIKDLSVEQKGDFVLSPAKLDVAMDPGTVKTEYLTITNRLGREAWFNVSVEDFTGSNDPGKTIILLGNEKGPYSLKDFSAPEIPSFTLKAGQEITFSVTITVPEDAAPGGLYGSVLITSQPSKGASGAITVSRLGALFFVRVNGDAKENGSLQDFSLKGAKKWFYEKGPFTFLFLYKNSGNVHLAPYGNITIRNSIGQAIDVIDIDPYFAMPDSVRQREITWNKDVLLGRYKAEINLNRGYKNIIDTKELIFWVIPWKFIVISFILICMVVGSLYYVGSKFEIKMKRKE